MKTKRWCLFLTGITCVYIAGGSLRAEEDTVSAPPSALQDKDARTTADLQGHGQAKALAQALYAQANRREMQDGFEAALPLYLAVIKTDPQFVELHLKIAYGYLRIREPGKALEQLLSAAQANPQSGDIQATIAYLHQNSGHLDQAKAAARSALQLESGNVLAHRVLFESLRDSGQIQEALDNAALLTKFESANPKVWADLARTYTEMICASSRLSRDELSAKITPLYDKAFALGNPSAELLAQRGEFVHFLGQKKEALEYFEQASQKGEPNPQLYIRVGNIHSQLGHTAEAIKNYEAAYELEPDLQLLREQLSYHYVLAGQEEKAIHLLEEILHKSPTRSGVYSALGDLYRQAKQLDKAEANYRQAIQLDPTNPDDHLKLAMLCLNQKRLSEASTVLTEARSRFPAHARVALFEAIVQREKGDFTTALDLFAQAKILADEKDKEFPYASYYYELSVTQEAAGKPQLSEATLKQGLNIDPNNENLLNALAYLWAQQGKNLNEALKLSKRSLQIAPDRGEYMDTLAWIHFKLGQYQQALPLLEKAAGLTQEHREVLEHLAEVYQKLGKTDEAIATLEKILQREPDLLAIRQKLDKIKKEAPVAQTKSPSAP